MIVVFGSIALDLVTNVSRIPEPGESLHCAGYALVPGSKGGNQALAAARSGARVIHIASVGRDAHAALATDLLHNAGVDMTHVGISERATGLCVVTVAADGENTVVAAAGANLDTRVAQLEAVVFGAGDTLVLQLEVTPDDNFAAAAHGQARGARVVLNAAPAAAVPANTLACLDFLIVNEHEVMIVAKSVNISARTPQEAGAALNSRYGCSTIVTLGAQGVHAWHAGTEVKLSAPVIRPVDTTAAGDSFVGAFVAALDAGADFSTALQRGVVAGSLACMAAGAQPAIPDLQQILSFISGT